nr:MAG TPA: hypothetical protein [Caudoviricetes sp.]
MFTQYTIKIKPHNKGLFMMRKNCAKSIKILIKNVRIINL